jgi:adenylosuccinate synthase
MFMRSTQIVTDFLTGGLQGLGFDGRYGDRWKSLTHADLLLQQQRLLCILGKDWGDEGKGRVVGDYIRLLQQITGLEDPVWMVLKVNGGANSGHSVDGLAHNLIPGGIKHLAVKYLALGKGVVACPKKLRWEERYLEHSGFPPGERLIIDQKTMLSGVWHRIEDLAEELFRAQRGTARGSTGRGIAPAYGDEVGHRKIYYGEYTGGKNKDKFVDSVRSRLDYCTALCESVFKLSTTEWNKIFFDPAEKEPIGLTQKELRAHRKLIDAGAFSADEFDFRQYQGSAPFTFNTDAVVTEHWDALQHHSHRIVDVRRIAREVFNNQRTVIGEFGQSFYLDKRRGFNGTTSSHTTSPEIFESLGISIEQGCFCVGVIKAYSTKVGTHFKPTAMEEGPLLDLLDPLEIGVSTGRQRDVCWLDCVAISKSVRDDGCDHLIINKIDELTGRDAWKGPLKICFAYKHKEDESVIRELPEFESDWQNYEPMYLELPVWNTSIKEVRRFEDLPQEAQDYIAAIYYSIISCAESTGHEFRHYPELSFVGVGPLSDERIDDCPLSMALLERGKKVFERYSA